MQVKILASDPKAVSERLVLASPIFDQVLTGSRASQANPDTDEATRDTLRSWLSSCCFLRVCVDRRCFFQKTPQRSQLPCHTWQ
jgi:hypothetical protein